MFRQKGFLYSPDDGGAGGGAGEGGGSGKEGEGGGSNEGLTFETFVQSLTDDQRKVIEDHTSGLKNGLQSERKTRSDLEKKVRDLAAQAEKGSEFESSLNDLKTQLESERLRADFNEEAIKQGVSNVRLAFLAAKDEGLVDDRGRINWDELKKAHPQLFVPQKRGNGDAGGGGNPAGEGDMNAFIRKQAGYN